MPPCSPDWVGLLRPCAGPAVLSLIWRIPKVSSNFASAAAMAAGGSCAVMTAWNFARLLA